MMRGVLRKGLVAACLFLTSCIFVGDFGKYWDQGTLDPLLAGNWKDKSGNCMEISKSGDIYLIGDRRGALDPARTLAVGQHRFLMVNPAKEAKYMFRYAVDKDTWTMYSPNEKKAEEFKKTYASQNVYVEDGTVGYAVTIRVLDEAAVEMLRKIADQPDYWVVSGTHQRSDCKLPDAEPDKK